MEPYWFGRDGEALWMFDALNTIKAGGEQIGNSFSLLGRFTVLVAPAVIPAALIARVARGTAILSASRSGLRRASCQI